jgi:hypothetical protein
MTDDEIRARVRAGLADGTLPRYPLAMAQPLAPGQPMPTGNMVARSTLPDPCTICGERSTQFSYPNAPAGPMSFHERCHVIWREESDKLW